MITQNRRFLDSLIPFIILGIGVAIAVALLILLSYVVIWGLFIGLCLWLIALIKNKFFPSKNSNSRAGVTIDYKDIE